MGLGVDLDMRRYIVNMEMRRYIVLLLITGIMWAQTDFDKLVLKNGTTYFGEYSKTEGKIVFFKPQEAFGFQPIPLKQIRQLTLKDGFIVFSDKVKNNLTLEEYQKLSTKEKAIYDASAAFLYSKEKFNFPKSILTDSEKEIYEQVYFKELQKRKLKGLSTFFIFAGVIVIVAAVRSWSRSFEGLDFGSSGG